METPKTSTDAQHVRQVVDQRATAEGRRYMWLHRKKHDIFVEIQKLKIRGTALASAGGRKRERDLKPKTNGEPTRRARKRRGGREEKPTVPAKTEARAEDLSTGGPRRASGAYRAERAQQGDGTRRAPKVYIAAGRGSAARSRAARPRWVMMESSRVARANAAPLQTENIR